MKAPILILTLLLVSLLSAAQSTFEITGTVSGDYGNRIFLFFENNLSQKDSISSSIENGNFRFMLNARQPILCRIHFSEHSNIKDFYVDGPKTELTLFSKLIRGKSDSVITEFTITDIKGSAMEDDKRIYYKWLEKNAKPGPDHTAADVAYPHLGQFVRTNPKSKLSAYLIAGGIHLQGNNFLLNAEPQFSYSQTRRLASFLDTSVRNTFEGQNLRLLIGHLAKQANRDTGKAFRDVVLKDTLEKQISTSSLRDKYVLVDFWASWCGPCRALNPDLKKLYAKYRQKGFEILGISLEDDKDAWKKAIVKDDLPWPQLIDEQAFQGILAKNYNIIGIPTKILLNPSGKVIAFDPSVYDLEKFLEGL